MLSLILLKLTLEGVLTDVPHDAASVIVYVVLALFVAFVWAGSRKKAPEGPVTPDRNTDDH